MQRQGALPLSILGRATPPVPRSHATRLMSTPARRQPALTGSPPPSLQTALAQSSAADTDSEMDLRHDEEGGVQLNPMAVGGSGGGVMFPDDSAKQTDNPFHADLDGGGPQPRWFVEEYDIDADGLIVEEFQEEVEVMEDGQHFVVEKVKKPENVKEQISALKLRTNFGASTAIMYQPTEPPPLPSKYTGPKAARRLLDTMGVHYDSSSQQQASASAPFGGIELHPGILLPPASGSFADGGGMRTAPLLVISTGVRSLKLSAPTTSRAVVNKLSNKLLGSLLPLAGGSKDATKLLGFLDGEVGFGKERRTKMDVETSHLDDVSQLYWTSVRQGW